MRRREFVSVTALGALVGCQKTRRPEAAYEVHPQPGRTASPVTYIIDYAVDHLDNAGYLKSLAEAPPQFLHVGQDTPFAGASGPVVVTKALTYVGLDLLTTEQLRARTRAIAKFVAGVHAAGVEKVFPYICNQTIAGDPGKRLAFWHFYDHWNDYQEFGIPPKPSADPLEWMQRDPAGHPHFNYPKAHERYVPQSRWAPCPNNEHWRGYLEFVTEQIAGCGYDGIFVDNNTLHCYCEYCQKAFRRYLLWRYKRAGLQHAFGTGAPEELRLHSGADRVFWAKCQPDFGEFLLKRHQKGELEEKFHVGGLRTTEEINEIGDNYLERQASEYVDHVQARYPPRELRRRFGTENLRQLGIDTPQQRRLWFETQRFWGWSIAEHLLRIARAGEKHKAGFLVLPNWGAMGTIRDLEDRRSMAKNLAEWKRATAWVMFEEHEMPGAVEYRLQYKLGLAQGVRPVILPWKQDGALVIELAHAEAAAGGGGAFVQGSYSSPNVRKAYRGLYTRRPELFHGLESLAHVGLAFFFNQSMMENPEHLRLLYPIKEALGREHFLWDTLTEDSMTRERLKDYQVVIVPDGIILEDDIQATLQAHAAAGGAVAWLNEIPSVIAEVIEKQAGRSLTWTSSQAHARLRANAYWKAEGRQTRVVVHVLNYGPTPERDVTVSILLPWEGVWKLNKLSMVLPLTGRADELHGTIENGCLRFQTSVVQVHSIIEAMAMKQNQ